MIPHWLIAVLFFLLSILGFTVTAIMYHKLSFIDWPYLIGGLFFLGLGLFVRLRNKN